MLYGQCLKTCGECYVGAPVTQVEDLLQPNMFRRINPKNMRAIPFDGFLRPQGSWLLVRSDEHTYCRPLEGSYRQLYPRELEMKMRNFCFVSLYSY
ncbi:hypothetical protein AVEN_226620-1 [Araneus ventricosus]|uniref:Uncharacterized protein n=1 Tax=Araneus ventricosus TaxID=182803 RepID=A0A4Y2EGQ7_ARAVE|nr:hypothetical protein AVEN_226620-1 [Araneus ventricosus]